MNMNFIRNYGELRVCSYLTIKELLGNIKWISDKDFQTVIEVLAWKSEGPSPGPAVPCYVTLSKTLYFSVPQSPHW